jgi:hypothetical protein
MSSRGRARRAVKAAVMAAAVASVSAATADAKVVTVTDDTAAQFLLGTQTSTVVRPLIGEDGAVELARTLEEQFNGTGLPTGWSSNPWPSDGAAAVAGDSLVVSGARADSGVSAGPGSSLEFRATFGTQGSQHVGFGTDFDTEPWAIFSTGSASGGKVYARVSTAAGPADDVDVEVVGIVPTDPHTYRIDWMTTGFAFFVDGSPVPVTTAFPPLPGTMRVQASDYTKLDSGVSVDSITLNNHKTPGTFISRKLDGGDARVTGLSFTATSDTPADTDIVYTTRTADTADGLDDATWAPLGAGGAVASPKQFVQYSAALSTTAVTATPRLDKVDVGFTIDDEAPTVTIQDVAVSGGTAKVTFSSDDVSADVECSLDGALFATCTSPAEFSSLAVGSHKIVVRATDSHGNPGSATRTFEVAAPPAPSGTTPPRSGTTPPPTVKDLTAPKVLVVGGSVRVSKSGIAKLQIGCPPSESRCAVTAKLKLGNKRIARKTLTLSGGSTRTFRLQLSKAARTKLAARSRLKVTLVVTAEDAAGNQKTTTRRMTLRAPVL